MTEPADKNDDRIRVLLLAPEGRSLTSLRELLSQVGNGGLSLDCVPSCRREHTQEDLDNYDLVFCDIAKEDRCSVAEAAHLPVIFLGEKTLGDSANDSEIHRILGSVFCHAGGGRCVQPCMALPILTAIDKYRKEKQNHSTEETLRQLRHTVEQSPDLVMITDRTGILEYVNPAFETVTGYSRDEVIGEALGILKSEQQAGELYEEMWNTVVSGKVFHDIVINRKKNGENFVLDKTITPMQNAEGEITHFISTGRDITTQRRLELQLQQAQKMDGIGRLAGGVAHDFNNLLMVISAYAELTLEALPEDDPLRGNVGEIQTAARRAANLTRQLLAFGRKQMQSLQLLDLNAVIQEICRMLPRLIGEDIQLVFLPRNGAHPHLIKADPVQIEQIVINLAANARDAMPCGGKLTIETDAVHLDESYVQLHPMLPLRETMCS